MRIRRVVFFAGGYGEDARGGADGVRGCMEGQQLGLDAPFSSVKDTVIGARWLSVRWARPGSSGRDRGHVLLMFVSPPLSLMRCASSCTLPSLPLVFLLFKQTSLPLVSVALSTTCANQDEKSRWRV